MTERSRCAVFLSPVCGYRRPNADKDCHAVPFDLTLPAAALVVGFPLLLLALLLVLGRLEDWMLRPGERAAAVTQLFDQVEEAEELERAVALMMSEVADRATARHLTPAARGRALRLARRSRA